MSYLKSDINTINVIGQKLGSAVGEKLEIKVGVRSKVGNKSRVIVTENRDQSDNLCISQRRRNPQHGLQLTSLLSNDVKPLCQGGKRNESSHQVGYDGCSYMASYIQIAVYSSQRLHLSGNFNISI